MPESIQSVQSRYISADRITASDYSFFKYTKRNISKIYKTKMYRASFYDMSSVMAYGMIVKTIMICTMKYEPNMRKQSQICSLLCSPYKLTILLWKGPLAQEIDS